MPVPVATLQITDQEVVSLIRQNPLFKHREQQSWSLRIVAAKCSCTPTTVSKWEDGTSYPTDDNMIKIAETMKMNATELSARWRAWYQLREKKEENGDGNQKDTSKTKTGK
jgi:transcriptional regulator with XRE-family HTH domain